MNSSQMRERILSAQMQHHHRLRLGILLVVGKLRLDQQFFADELGRRVAALTDYARGTQVLDRRLNRRGVFVEADLEKLFGAVDLGAEVGLRARADMALDTCHMRVRRDLVGRVLRMHHMAALPAKLRRIHVSRAAITGHGHHQQVDDRRHQHDVQAVAEDVVIQIDLRIRDGNQPGLLELSAPHPYANGDQQQPANKYTRQQEEEDDA